GGIGRSRRRGAEGVDEAPFGIGRAPRRDVGPFLEMYGAVGAEGRYIRTEEPRSAGLYRRMFRVPVTSDRARLLAVAGDRVIGEIGVEREDHPVTRHVASIGMMVAPDWRRRGVRASFMEAAIPC